MIFIFLGFGDVGGVGVIGFVGGFGDIGVVGGIKDIMLGFILKVLGKRFKL